MIKYLEISLGACCHASISIKLDAPHSCGPTSADSKS